MRKDLFWEMLLVVLDGLERDSVESLWCLNLCVMRLRFNLIYENLFQVALRGL